MHTNGPPTPSTWEQDTPTESDDYKRCRYVLCSFVGVLRLCRFFCISVVVLRVFVIGFRLFVVILSFFVHICYWKVNQMTTVTGPVPGRLVM